MVIGGTFWKAYREQTHATPEKQQTEPDRTPAGLDPALFQVRPPIDLSNPLLRTLAAGLGPAYIRVSGTWANTTYFHESSAAAPSGSCPTQGSTATADLLRGLGDAVAARGPT